MLASATASLEQQLDNLERLPVELQKNFAAMRTMDLKTKKMSQKIDSESDAVLAKKLAGPAGSKEIAKIQRMYAKLQKHLDEKVQLAVLTYELVDKHIRHLDADLSRYQSECQENEKQQQAEAKTAAAAAAAAVKPSTSSASAAAAAGTAPSTSSRKSSSGSMAAIKKKKRRAVESSEEEKPRRRGGGKGEKGGGGGGGGKAAPSTAAAAASGSAESKAASSAAAGSRSRERAPATPEPPEPGVIPGLALAAKEAGEVFDMPVDPNEPTYCLCQQVSYGDMIGCDNPDCPIEWFHFPCVGLTSKPKGNWYCPKCSEERKKKK